MDRPSGVVSREVRSEGNVFIMFSTHQFSHTWLEIDSLTSYFTQNGTNYTSKDKVTVCRFKKRYHWSKTCILCFYHQIPRLSADTWARPPPPADTMMTLLLRPPSGRQLIYGWPLRCYSWWQFEYIFHTRSKFKPVLWSLKSSAILRKQWGLRPHFILFTLGVIHISADAKMSNFLLPPADSQLILTLVRPHPLLTVSWHFCQTPPALF